MTRHQNRIQCYGTLVTMLFLLFTVNPLAEEQSNHKIINVSEKLDIVVPEGFVISHGPKTLDHQIIDTEQPLISIFHRPNQLVCQIATTVHTDDMSKDEAIKKARLDSIETVTFVSESEVGNGKEIIYRIKRSDSAEVTAISRSVFFNSAQSNTDRSYLYRVFCASESRSFSKNEPVIQRFFKTIHWH